MAVLKKSIGGFLYKSGHFEPGFVYFMKIQRSYGIKGDMLACKRECVLKSIQKPLDNIKKVYYLPRTI